MTGRPWAARRYAVVACPIAASPVRPRPAHATRWMGSRAILISEVVNPSATISTWNRPAAMSAVPATAATYVVETLLARVLLMERVPWQRWAGALLVAVGVLLLAA